MGEGELHILLTLAVLLAGGGMFLRLVAKEKHRREKWLLFRHQEKIKKLKARKFDRDDEIIIAR